MAKVKVLALGGLDEKQRKMYILDIDSKMYILDAGVYEPLKNDFGIQHFIPNMDYLIQNKDKIKAVFLSSANRMNIGSLPQLIKIKPDIEIYGSKTTLDSLPIFFGDETKNWKKINFKKGEIKNISGIEVASFLVSSTIPGTLGYKFKTKDGNILYVTDYIFDSVKEYNVSPIIELSNLINEKNLLLITDSSMASEKIALSSKIRIKNLIDKYIEKNKKFVITIYEDEILNVVELIELAKKHNKNIFFKSNTLLKLILMMMDNNEIEKFPIKHYSDFNFDNLENSIVVISGTRTKLYRTVELLIESNNKKEFSFTQDDIVFFSAKKQAGNEHIFASVKNKISRFDPMIISSVEDEKMIFGTTEFDIRNVINVVKPKFVMPVSAYYSQLNSVRNIAIENGIKKENVFVGDNGDVFLIENGENKGILNKIKNIEPKVIESFGDESIDNKLIEERKMLGKDGIVTISFLFDSKRMVLASDIDIQMKGLVISKGQEEVLQKIRDLILAKSDELSETNQNIKKDVSFLKKAITKIFRENFKKAPTLIINIIEVD